MVMNGRSNSSQCTWSNAWPFSVFPLAKNFRRIFLKFVGPTVLRLSVPAQLFYLVLFALSFLLNFIHLLVV